MEYKDYYAVLGVDRHASADQIKQAYRKLARKYHPDVSKEAQAEEQFKNVQEAYEVLKDSEKRRAYDQLGSQWKAGQEFRPPPDWQSFSRFYGDDTQGVNEEDLGGFSDFFTNLFGGHSDFRGGRSFRSFKQRGNDQHAKVNISLEEAFRGTTKSFQLQTIGFDQDPRSPTHVRNIKVNIPPGTTQGQQLRLSGQGTEGQGGAPNGDLYLEIDIEPHPYFSLEGKDVYLTLPVTPWEAALGGEIKIPTLGGPVELRLASGSHAGQKLRLKGRGMPGHPAGNQYVILQIEIPPIRTDAERELYQKMAEVMPFNPRKAWAV